MRPSTFGLCLLVALSCESPARARTLAVVPLSHQREAASRDVDASSRQLAALLSAAGWSVLESEAVLDQLFGAGPRVQLRKQQLRRFHQLARQGREQLNGLELAGAEVSLSRALELTPRIGAWLTSPRELAQVRFLLGLVYQRTEQPQRAARAYRRAAALDPDFMPSPTEYPPEILKEFSTARQENQQAEVCPLQLRSFPSGARVHVDGRALGLTPLKVKLPLGEHYLLLERQGHAPASRAVRPCGNHLDRGAQVAPQAPAARPADPDLEG